MRCERCLFLSVYLVGSLTSAQAIYTWEDAHGVHFTDDLSLVPSSKRSQVQALKSLGSAPLTETGAAIAPVAKPTAEAAAKQEADEQRWRERFVKATRRLEGLAASIEALKSTLPPRIECVPQPLVPFGNVVVNGSRPSIVAGPGSQVVTANGVTSVVTSAAPQFGVVPGVCRVSEVHERQMARITEEVLALDEARKDFEALDREASLRGIPREWRRGW
jgi:hypothetical protein